METPQAREGQKWPKKGTTLKIPFFWAIFCHFCPVQLGAVFHFDFPFFSHFWLLAVFHAMPARHDPNQSSADRGVGLGSSKSRPPKTPETPKKSKSLESDPQSNPKSNPKSHFLTRKSHFWVTFRVKKWLLGLGTFRVTLGETPKVNFSHFQVTLNFSGFRGYFSGFRGFWEVWIFLSLGHWKQIRDECRVGQDGLVLRRAVSTRDDSTIRTSWIPPHCTIGNKIATAHKFLRAIAQRTRPY